MQQQRGRSEEKRDRKRLLQSWRRKQMCAEVWSQEEQQDVVRAEEEGCCAEVEVEDRYLMLFWVPGLNSKCMGLSLLMFVVRPPGPTYWVSPPSTYLARYIVLGAEEESCHVLAHLCASISKGKPLYNNAPVVT